MSTKYKTYKQQYIYIEETLIVSKVANLITKKEGKGYSKGKTPIKRVRVRQHYRHYSTIKHNSYTYKVKVEDASNSKASK